MKPKFLSGPLKFRKWLEANHKSKKELLVGFYKKSSGKPSITWPESVDQALCFGWIDGIRRSIDDISYSIRFTPRNPKSTWSAVNIKKAEQLKKSRLMKPAGLAAFNKREEKNSKIYSFEQKEVKFSKEFLKLFKINKIAWEGFQKQPPYYRKAVTHWVMSAKQEITRLRRLNTLIKDSEAGLKIKQMRRAGK
ncbi:MAG TPA: YdeI/OmpD-associated family protein [Ignavibacteriaceae bacterium]|nr:YdeI/OmpD-associated family protein [Ignavibacteriaceae bacterium]